MNERVNERVNECVNACVNERVNECVNECVNACCNCAQQLTGDLQARESRFSSVQDRGEALVMERHPASNIIRVRRRLTTLFYC